MAKYTLKPAANGVATTAPTMPPAVSRPADVVGLPAKRCTNPSMGTTSKVAPIPKRRRCDGGGMYPSIRHTAQPSNTSGTINAPAPKTPCAMPAINSPTGPATFNHTDAPSTAAIPIKVKPTPSAWALTPPPSPGRGLDITSVGSLLFCCFPRFFRGVADSDLADARLALVVLGLSTSSQLSRSSSSYSSSCERLRRALRVTLPTPLAEAVNTVERPLPTARRALPVRSFEVSAARRAGREFTIIDVLAASPRSLRCGRDDGPVFLRVVFNDPLRLLTDMYSTIVAESSVVTGATPV